MLAVIGGKESVSVCFSLAEGDLVLVLHGLVLQLARESGRFPITEDEVSLQLRSGGWLCGRAFLKAQGLDSSAVLKI